MNKNDFLDYAGLEPGGNGGSGRIGIRMYQS